MLPLTFHIAAAPSLHSTPICYNHQDNFPFYTHSFNVYTYNTYNARGCVGAVVGTVMSRTK